MEATKKQPPRLNDISTTDIVYEQLTRDREIRLLELMPGVGDEQIVCRLHHSIVGQVEYEAISYTWGKQEHRTTITCNGQPFTTTRNLADALTRLRRRSTSRRLWADQICINQNDDEEKEQRQIPLMPTIYAHASAVFVWLGDEIGATDVNVDMAMEIIPRLCQAADMGQVVAIQPGEAAALNKLLTHSWFSRVWTLQEVAMAKKTLLLRRDGQFDWDLLRRFSDCCQTDRDGHWTTILRDIGLASDKKTGEYTRYVTANVIAITQHKVDRTATAVSGVQPGDALHLHRVRSCGATELKDKVLAILHWFSNDLKIHLESFQYGKHLTAGQLYASVAAFKLAARRDMDFFSAAGLVQRSVEHASMPSWVPDWNAAEATHDLWVLDRLRQMRSHHHLYNAGGIDNGTIDVSIDGRQLTVTAKIIDEVDFIGPGPRFSIRNDEGNTEKSPMQQALTMGRERHRLIDDCLKLAADRCRTHYGDGFASACRQTLLRGIVQEGVSPAVGGVLKRADDEELEILFHDYQKIMLFVGVPTFRELPVFDRVAARMPLDVMINSLQKVRLVEQIQDSFKGRVFFTSKNGYMGLGPHVKDRAQTSVSDKVAVVRGCCAPFVVRPITGQSQVLYELIGEAYVHGLMDGEAAERDDIAWESTTFQ